MEYKITKLKNGGRIITAPIKDTEIFAIIIGIRVGSRDEAEEQAGIAHFIEHMFFKGTKKRPSPLNVSKDLDGLGAHFNAFTSQEMTGFYIECQQEKQAEAVEILFDMLDNNLFDRQEIEKEKGVICEEINMYEDMPQAKVYDEFLRLLYPDNSLGRFIAGSKKTVNSLCREDMLAFEKKHYSSGKMAIALAGKINQKTIEFVEKKLKSRKAEKPLPYSVNPHTHKGVGVNTNKNRTGFIKRTNTEHTKVIKKKVDQAHIALGFPTFSLKDERRFTLAVLDNILGGMMSSKLFYEVRVKKGLAYYINSSVNFFTDTGYIAVRAGLAKTKLDYGLEAIEKQLLNFTKTKISEADLARSKQNFVGNFYLGLEGSLEVAKYLIEQELLENKIEIPNFVVNQIEKVSKNDIMFLAKDIFQKDKMRLAIVR
ncbi:MAG: Processing protease [Candidatus Berkelbacteria bacterium Licking1014_7]|uniref:Processing protease n=1 Tax=Candidatus Berkelbacteria bacterium Licking1014_7 TaxID=2017147 RepID=A0A554LI51_9BACT|nr:MAG: Processing protease [Candidatus Berkelbacteria bacterium Licking1014_7]